MGKTAFLCAGEAAARVGMGVDLVPLSTKAADLFELAADATGLELFGLCAQGPDEELGRPQNAGPCAVVTALAVAELLRQGGVEPQAVAGYGAGEYAALALAGVLDAETALALAARRGAMLALGAARGEDGWQAAERSMGFALKGALFGRAELPCYLAATAAPYDVAEVEGALLRQMHGEPAWEDLVAALCADGVDRFVVCGPDAGLAGRTEGAAARAGASSEVLLAGSAADCERLQAAL